jgi:RNA polymerase sigma-70 factor (ECF subfamily)
VRIARRWARGADAEDALHESLLAAHAAGKADFDDATNRRWIAAVIRNKARLAARTAVRRRERECRWHAEQPRGAPERVPGEVFGASDLPPGLRAVALLALSGLDRGEIRLLLGLTDQALRKRISSLGKRLAAERHAAPNIDGYLGLPLAYGRIRRALSTLLRHDVGHFATHDPDGHLLVIRRA